MTLHSMTPQQYILTASHGYGQSTSLAASFPNQTPTKCATVRMLTHHAPIAEIYGRLKASCYDVER